MLGVFKNRGNAMSPLFENSDIVFLNFIDNDLTSIPPQYLGVFLDEYQCGVKRVGEE
jgi:hypothetical protein